MDVYNQFASEKVICTYNDGDVVVVEEMLSVFREWFSNKYDYYTPMKDDKIISQINYTDIGSFYKKKRKEYISIRLVR